MKREDDIARVTLAGSVVNLLLVGVKAFAGVAGHSAAMVSDAVHSLSDFITDIVVLVFVRVSARPQDEDHDYGHGKYETSQRCSSDWRSQRQPWALWFPER